MSGVWRCLASVSADDSICVHTPKRTHGLQRETMESHRLEVGYTRILEGGGEETSISLLPTVCSSPSPINRHPWWDWFLQLSPTFQSRTWWQVLSGFHSWFPLTFSPGKNSFIHSCIHLVIQQILLLSTYQVPGTVLSTGVTAMKNTVTEVIASSWGIKSQHTQY